MPENENENAATAEAVAAPFINEEEILDLTLHVLADLATTYSPAS